LLLLAEARERGWVTTGTAETYFRDGVKSAINQLKLYSPPASLFDDAAINTYTSATLVFPAATAARLQAINEQYYAASFLDGYEPHANWRRSGFPALTGVNLSAAITRQGANTWVTRVWWDSN
jgi:ABC-type sugar transport system permease subunit